MKTTGNVAAASKCQMRRNPSHVSGTRDRVSSDSEDGETEHTISRRDVRDIGANCFNDAADFVAKNARIRSIARIKRQRLEHVAEIHSGRFHFDQHLTRAARRQFERSEAEGVETAAFAAFQTQRQERIEPLLGGEAAAVQSSNIASFTSQGDLALRVFAR